MPRPVNYQGRRREREMQRQDKRLRKQEKRAAGPTDDPRRQVHDNAFPDAPEAFEGIARTLSAGLR